jgi:hypothetical protein
MKIVAFSSSSLLTATPKAGAVGAVILVIGAILGIGVEKAITKWLLDAPSTTPTIFPR